MNSTLDDRLDGIERRLANVECHLGLARQRPVPAHRRPAAAQLQPPVAEPAYAGAANAVKAVIAPVVAVVDDVFAAARTLPARMSADRRDQAPPPIAPPPLPVRDQVAPQIFPATSAPIAPLSYEAPPPPSLQAQKQNPWEQLIGLKLAGWIGAIVLVVGAGLGIKYAYDRGFFAGVSPVVWLSLLSLSSFALIAAGEYVYRRISHISATGLFGAGVAMLFVVSYAGHGYYELYQQQTAFTLMALSTLIGASVAMRGRLVSIAVLALIGGALAPLVLRGDQPLVTPFLCYLLMLQIVALVLSWWGASPKWWTLRGVSLAATGLWMFTLVTNASGLGAVMLFAIIFAVLYHAEIILSATRWRDSLAARGAGSAFSVTVTAALAAAMLWLLRGEADAVGGIVMVTLSAVTLAMSIVLRRLSPDQRLVPLSYAYRMQAAALAVVAVPVAFSGAAVSIGWGALAITLAAVGAQTRDRATRITSTAAWILSIINLLVWSITARAESHAIWLTILNQPLHAWLMLAWGLVVCGHMIARLHEAGDADNVTPRAEGRTLSIFASALFALASVVGLTPMSSSIALVIYAWTLIGATRFAPQMELAPQAAGVIALTMFKWLVFDTVSRGILNEWAAAANYWPIFNPMTVVGVALAGSMLMALKVMRGGRSASEPMQLGAAWAAMLVVLWAGTMEIDRLVELGRFAGGAVWPAWQLRNFTWTAWWSAGLTTFLVAAHFRDRTALRRYQSLHILASVIILLGCKYLLFDTLVFRLMRGPAAATVIANLQTFAGAVVFASLVLVRYVLSESGDEPRARQTMRSAAALAMTMLLWIGSLEIDRAFRTSPAVMAMFTDPKLAGQVALSIFWSIFAIAAVASGFKIRLAALRYFGLALFALTLAKVTVIDLQSAATGYRILSFIGLGGLLLGTSVLYGKLSPRLLRDPEAA